MKTLTVSLLLLAVTLSTVAAEKKIVHPPEFPTGRPYSPGVQSGDTLYCSGQTGSDLKSGQYPDKFEDEVHNIFKRIRIILEAAGYGYPDVVDVKVFLADISLYSRMNAVYTQYFKKDRPARTTVAVAALPGNARIEITAVARK